MTEKEIDVLTWYMTGLNTILLDKFRFTEGEILKQRPSVSIFRDYIIKERGISEEAIQHFKIGANLNALLSDGKPRREQYWYWELFSHEATKNLSYQYTDVEAKLSDLNLINARNNDYWFRPAIIIPYMYDGQVYWAEARTLPQYVEPEVPIRYMGMKGIMKECFFNEDALDYYSEIYVVEGAINGLSLWCHGIENVISFGSKNQLTDELISRLLGKNVILYVDTDKHDPDNQVRSDALNQLQDVAMSISYLDFPPEFDINDLHMQVSHDRFMDEIEARTVEVADPYDWLPEEVRDRQDKENVISLSEAQQKNRELMTTIGGNLRNYIGMKVLNNMPVGTGKTTSTIEGMNLAPKVQKLVAVSQHNLADEYLERLNTDSLVHLFGRTHKVVDCRYKDEAEILCNKGYSVYFKLNYCLGKCEKAPECIHLDNSRRAKHAEVLIATHSHIELMDFLMNDYYGNNLRQMVVIDEAPKLVKDIYFTRQDIIDNLANLRQLTNKLKGKGLLFAEHVLKSESLVKVLEGMDKALSEKEEYSPHFDIPLVPVTVEDLEEERQFMANEIPVLHFGMLGTNLLKDFQILLEINAHYYSPDVIIEDFKTEFGIELSIDKFVKREKVFKTVDKEYLVKGWEYDDKKYTDLTKEVNLYIQNNSQADMEQLEGRILRGEDTFKLIIRLHNVNIKPYPNAVYKSWQTMFKKEFGYIKPKKLKGKAKQVYEWLVENASGREFTVKELIVALGGYRPNHLRILKQLETMEYIKITKKGRRGGSENAWMLT